jgi:hypothetical protein
MILGPGGVPRQQETSTVQTHDHKLRAPTKEERDRHHQMVTQKPADADHAPNPRVPHKAEHSTLFDGTPVVSPPTPQEHEAMARKAGHHPLPDPNDPAVRKATADRQLQEVAGSEKARKDGQAHQAAGGKP